MAHPRKSMVSITSEMNARMIMNVTNPAWSIARLKPLRSSLFLNMELLATKSCPLSARKIGIAIMAIRLINGTSIRR